MKAIKLIRDFFEKPGLIQDLRRMVGFFIRRRSWAEADDLLQQAVLEMLKRPDNVRAQTPEEIRKWLRTNTRRRFLDEREQRRRMVPLAAVPEQEDRRRSDASQMEHIDMIRELIDHLSQADRELVRLRYYEDLSSEMIAKQIGLKPSGVEKALYRIRQRLGETLKKTLECRSIGRN